MADKSKTKLPNLKICIDNTDSDDSSPSESSDDDKLSLDHDEEIDEPQESALIEKGEDEETGLDVASDTKTYVEFNVRLGPTSKKRSEIRPYLKTYENKAGSFVTGIDLTNQEELKKKEERAKRFGIEISQENEANISDLYKSLGIREEDLSRKDERGIRLEAIHFRGVDDMSTKDIFAYFKEFGPAGVEWIDDFSCNVVWLDKVTAARAMMKLSRSYDAIMQHGEEKEMEKKVVKGSDPMETNEKKEKNDKREENSSETHKFRSTSNKTRDAKSLRDGEEPMEEDSDDEDSLDLIEDSRKRVIEDKCSNAERESKTADQESKSDREDGELTDDSDSEDDGGQKENKGETKFQLLKNIPWPPGKWRLGITTSKARCLFMRFATKADTKLPGAERRSRYYQKYGNPNYGGIKGLISTSRKRKYNATRILGDVEEDKEAMEKAQRKIISYAGVDMFTDVSNKDDDVRNVEHADSAWGVGPNKPVSDQPKFIFEKSPEEEKPRFILEQSELGTKHIKDVSEDSDDSEVDEEELERLLGPPIKTRTMRMYADDVEEEIKKKKTLKQGDLTITSDIKRGSSPVRIKDARELIKGVQVKPKETDIKTRLQLRTRLSPLVWDDEDSQSSHESDWHAAADDDDDDDHKSSPDARHVKSRVSRDRSPDSRLYRTIENKGTDLRSKLDTRKKTGSSKFQNMKIEVFD